ncbi:type II toxin-antitoxin system HicB family antitoxin [Brevibacillus borstelensis]|uniref:type II toxin-antitoxin system HicB family antitoxin n=1 Tax=Brevibacillus borstelensis TaxID=45462 RepID=UPI002E24E730|nr:type II toxin-antitoxin system HicB family antitoxin [Brevibacillus borstelensis]
MRKDRYIYPAKFLYEPEGVTVTFPDLPGCITCGYDTAEAFRMAREAMSLHLYGMEQDDEAIPEPSDPAEIKPEPGEIVTLIETWMPPFRDEMEQKAVKKTLTIPKWLDDLAQEHKVNFSHILQDALKQYLGVSDRGNKI